METESFRERNRQRRARNAFQHLRAYAEARELPDAETAAREAAEQMHSAEGAAGRAERQRQRARAAAERAARQTDSRVAEIASPPAQPPQPAAEPARDAVPHRLEDRTKEQLYARAQELEVEGRSQMTKDQLIAAIRAKQ